MRFKHVVSFLLFILAFSLKTEAQVPGFFMKQPAKKVEIPFLVSNNLIILPVRINEGPPINFLVDTGVKTSILFSKTLGDQLNLSYTRKLDLVGADGSTILTASVSPNNTMDMGKIEGMLQTLLVLDEDFFELEFVLGIPVYGVLGYEFFKYNPVKIDYEKAVMTFYHTDGLKWRPFGFRKLPIQIENSKPYLQGSIKQAFGEELSTKLLIDTGANHGLLLNMETSDKIKLPPHFIQSELGRSLGGDLFGYVGRVKYLNLAGLKFPDVLTSYPEETEFSYVIKESGRQGSIGSEVWGRTTLIIDYKKERIFLKKGSNFSNPFEFDMSGLTTKMLPTEEKRFYISHVRDGSPAYVSGLLPDDEIIMVNRIPLDFWELSDLVKLFRSEEGREISLGIKRYNVTDAEEVKEMEFRFRLRRQI
jgi:predicted aspartyl protease